MAAFEAAHEFDISAAALQDVCNARRLDIEGLACNCLEDVAAAMRTSCQTGLAPDGEGPSYDSRRAVFGANRFKEVQQKAFLVLLYEQLKDPIILLLMAAALVSTVLGFAIESQREENAWTEGIAIWVAVLVVSLVGAGNDYQKDRHFRKLNAQKDMLQVKVLRGGVEGLVPNTDVMVGDLLVLETGDRVVADGMLTECRGLVADEASLTGESEPLHKGANDLWCWSGTQVTEGSGRLLVLAVGVHSEYGKTMSLVMSEPQLTPLQLSLRWLAAQIGKVGLGAALVCFVVLMIRWFIEEKGNYSNTVIEGPLNFFIFAVTIVVVAVPEGLPLAVTISLAYSMRKMMKDNNFVRVLAACETMGSATAICSDKTGTLTQNRMTVTEGWFAGAHHSETPGAAALPAAAVEAIVGNCASNSTAFLVEHAGGRVESVGNRTECALLLMLRDWGVSWKAARDTARSSIRQVYLFSSVDKMASVLLPGPHGGQRLYTKGAAELVVARCAAALGADGTPFPLTTALRTQLQQEVQAMASRGLRTLCLAYRDLPSGFEPEEKGPAPAEELTCCAIVGIKDPMRKEVPAAVAACRRAGVSVRMVTGDNADTARFIAAECGIYTAGGLVLEGPAFRELSEEQIRPLLPKLQVLARSSPSDKYNLVKMLKASGEVVAVTGDGTNDAPALKEANVGLAMGIAGTEVAKEASDLIILDDNFSTIVKSLLWGRSVYANLRKFLQFQLTVNLTAIIIAFVAAVTSGETPLTVIQLLWVNLIMDSLGALALATESPTPDLLLDKPNGKDEFIVNARMVKHILAQGVYQLFWLFLIVYGAPAHVQKYAVSTQCSNFAAVRSDAYYVKQPLMLTSIASAPYPASFDLCCTPGTDCVVPGSLYRAGEPPMCIVTGPALEDCRLQAPFPPTDTAAYCVGSGADCARLEDFRTLWRRAEEQHAKDVEHDHDRYESVVFNLFIFCQLFNQINARKVKDELNVFEDLHKRPVFVGILLVEVVAQIVIMLTPVATFFNVTSQTWQEWLFAIVVGAGSLLVSLLTKLISRACEAAIRRRRSSKKAVEQALPVINAGKSTSVQ